MFIYISDKILYRISNQNNIENYFKTIKNFIQTLNTMANSIKVIANYCQNGNLT